MATENSHADALTQDERDAFGRLVARASTFPDHNGRSGPVTRVGYTDLQTVVALVKREILSPVEQPAAAPTIPAGQALVPIERSYDMRVKALIAFNAAEKAGNDRDDALDAAYQAMIAAALRSPTQVDADDVQVELSADLRGMNITVWRNRHCIYTGAHALPIADSPAMAAVTQVDYEEVLANHRQLVRELDVLLNGEEGAAKQASLGDIVAQVRRERAQRKTVRYDVMSKYASLDTLILAEINFAPASFDSLFAGAIRREYEAWERLKITGVQEPVRLLTRRLQALRKAGKIRSTREGWVRQSSRCDRTIDMFDDRPA